MYVLLMGMGHVLTIQWTGHGLYGTNFLNKGQEERGTVRHGQVRTGRERNGEARTGKARKPIKFASECEECPDCGEPWCDECEEHYAECDCPGPDSDDNQTD